MKHTTLFEPQLSWPDMDLRTAYGNMFVTNAYVKPFALLTKPKESLTTWWSLCKPNTKQVRGEFRTLLTWPSSILCSCNAMFFSLTFRDSLGSWPTFVFGSNTRWLAASQTPLSIQHRQNTCKKNQRSTSACYFRIEVEMYSICVDLLEIPPSTLVSTCNNSDTSSRPIAKTSHCSNVEWNPAKWPRFSFGQGDS